MCGYGEETEYVADCWVCGAPDIPLKMQFCIQIFGNETSPWHATCGACHDEAVIAAQAAIEKYPPDKKRWHSDKSWEYIKAIEKKMGHERFREQIRPVPYPYQNLRRKDGTIENAP